MLQELRGSANLQKKCNANLIVDQRLWVPTECRPGYHRQHILLARKSTVVMVDSSFIIAGSRTFGVELANQVEPLRKPEHWDL